MLLLQNIKTYYYILSIKLIKYLKKQIIKTLQKLILIIYYTIVEILINIYYIYITYLQSFKKET